MHSTLTDLQWKTDIIDLITDYSTGDRFTSDNIRTDASNQGLRAPTDEHAWGSVILAASSMFLIKKTGQYIQSQIPSNHGRMVAEWQRTDFRSRAKAHCRRCLEDLSRHVGGRRARKLP